MIALEVFGETPAMIAVADRLTEIAGVSRVRMEPARDDRRPDRHRPPRRPIGRRLTDWPLAHGAAQHTARELIPGTLAVSGERSTKQPSDTRPRR